MNIGHFYIGKKRKMSEAGLKEEWETTKKPKSTLFHEHSEKTTPIKYGIVIRGERIYPPEETRIDNQGKCISNSSLAWLWLQPYYQCDERYVTDFKLVKDIPTIMYNVFDRDKIKCKASTYYLDHTSGFGATLEKISNHLTETGDEINALLHFTSNTMAIKIILKETDLLIKFYDPLLLFSHIELTNVTLDTISQLELPNILGNTQVKDFQSFCLAVYKNLDTLPDATADKDIICGSVVEQERIYYALAYDFTKLVQQTVGQVLAHTSIKNKKDYLNKLDSYQRPGLYIALQEGYDKTVKAFIDLVLKCDGLNNKDKVDLLAAKHKREPGLYKAFCLGKTETILAFTELVLNSSLSGEEKVYLLEAKNANGDSGLYEALCTGLTETVLAFTELILSSSLSDKEKIRILIAKDATNKSGYEKARENEHIKTAEAFTALISSSSPNIQIVIDVITQI